MYLSIQSNSRGYHTTNLSLVQVKITRKCFAVRENASQGLFSSHHKEKFVTCTRNELRDTDQPAAMIVYGSQMFDHLAQQ